MVYRYQQIADHLETLVASRALGPGARIPSVRALAGQFEVSTNTVLQALATLEARNVVLARPQSGYYVCTETRLEAPHRSRGARAAPPRRIADRVPGFLRAMRDGSMVQLGAACPDPTLLPGRRLAAALRRAAGMPVAKALVYDPLPGYALLRREIARRMARTECAVTADHVLTTAGALEAMHIALRAVTRPGDTVAVESPCYFAVLELCAALGLRVLELSTDAATGVELESLRRALGHRAVRACIFVPNFSNPLGSLVPADTKRAIVELCTRRRVPIIESDVYGELVHAGERPVPLKAFDRAGYVLYCSSFSKTLAPSFRVGWLVPGRFFEQAERVKFALSVATPTVTQAAIAELLIDGGYDHHLRALRRALRDQVQRARGAIAHHFPEGTRVSDPRGGFLLWVELPEGRGDTTALQRRALEHRISIGPGAMFSTGASFSRCLRLSCGAPWSEKLERAFATLGRLATG